VADVIERRIGVTTATLIVVAAMVGTGIFTTTGFLVRDIGNLHAVLFGWGLGGVIALFGAFAYGELVAMLPHNGGEYQLLARIYHPSVGFLAGWTSFVVGFSAPLAASALAFGEYLELATGGTGVHPTVSAVALIVVVSAVHALRVEAGSGFQNVFTLGKILLIVAFVVGGLWAGDASRIGSGSTVPLGRALVSSPFAVGLIYISFAYAGWNSAAYVAGEVRAPSRNLPIALFAGTAVVTLLYVAVSFVFLVAAPVAELAASEERVASVAATGLFGDAGGRVISAIIALGLVSNVGAIVMTGPRVYEAMGRDFAHLAPLGRRRIDGGPVLAIAIQAGLGIAMALTSSFDVLLEYIGFTLSGFAMLTVAGVFVLRAREPELARPYRATGHPVTSTIFLLLSGWMVVHTGLSKLEVAAAGAATLLVGLAAYAGLARR
jgi:APA family basic amino acid/polyamine antiporter